MRYWAALSTCCVATGLNGTQLTAAAASTKAAAAFLSGAVARPRRRHTSKHAAAPADLLKDPLEDELQLEYTTAEYPRYPYYDAPRNLFFDASRFKEQDEKDDREAVAAASETQRAYMKNAELRQQGENVDPLDSSPIAVFDRTIGSDYRDYVYTPGKQHGREEMRTDVAEYDVVRPGIAPWPSYEQLKADGMELRTSLFVDLDPRDPLEKHLIGKPMRRNDVTTLGEARTAQRRWLRRSYLDEWPLTYEEFAAMPLDMREAYYANRYQVADEEERFAMVLQYRRALGEAASSEHPAEFRHMEDSYTHTPKDSPVAQDLMNWDDPLDAPWRLRVEECIRDCVTYGWPPEPVRFHTCFEVYDVTWLAGAVKVVIEQTRDEGGDISPAELKLMLLKLETRLRELDEVEHTQSVANHTLMLVARHSQRRADEGKPKRLICRRDWNEQVGRKVTVTFTDSGAAPVVGVMLGSHSALGLDLEVSGERQTLPLSFIRDVRLN
ncbi:uncharacterized protein BcabD6B2_47240 [Babesia caballi]|uniref:Uncharacterized protein n=1 Tax=Babesia caballi TaxID=5871 RepID=A0AAV4LYV9_BABCB|nr:hypothetical protein, conserved [Babesia caballi]